MTNILRHGRAANAEIRVERKPSHAVVEILNDRRAGPQSDDPSASEQAGTTSGTGLAGLRERVGQRRRGGGRRPARRRVPLLVSVPTPVIRILVAEDQALVRGAIVALLGLEPDLEVIAEAARGDEVVPRALETRPDVALVDIEMPGIDGLAATAQLQTAGYRPAGSSWSPRSAGPATSAGQWRPVRRGSCSRTLRRRSSPRRSAVSRPAVASSIRRWHWTHSRRAPTRCPSGSGRS